MSTWGDKAFEWLRKQRATRIGETITADDVFAALGSPDPDHAANSSASAMGALFRKGKVAHIIEDTGTHFPSTQKHRKGGMNRVWRFIPDPYAPAPEPSGPPVKVIRRRGH